MSPDQPCGSLRPLLPRGRRRQCRHAEQWFARLPVSFLGLLALALLFALLRTFRFLRTSLSLAINQGAFGLRRPVLLLARSRRILLMWAAALAPVGFLVIQHATLYDGVRHTLFVIPMLALLAGWAFVRLLRMLSRARIAIAMLAAVYVAAVVIQLARLHPLEYVAMNAFAGGTAGACGRFELDYWGAAATEALRRLEYRLDSAETSTRTPPGILICIPYREQMAGTMRRRDWQLALDAKQADFVIETERSRCAKEPREHTSFCRVNELTAATRWPLSYPMQTLGHRLRNLNRERALGPARGWKRFSSKFSLRHWRLAK